MTQHKTLTGLAMDNFPFECVDEFVTKVTEKLATAPRDICQTGKGLTLSKWLLYLRMATHISSTVKSKKVARLTKSTHYEEKQSTPPTVAERLGWSGRLLPEKR
ncbi:MAG: hypothetical protein GY818_13345 [Planctomycetaceae bacterium]|nr:hypothetical protein [Planctomycetaceae bacterium]